MRKYLYLFLVLILVISPKVWADYYNPQHWLLGSLEAGSAPVADGHNVYTYYPPTSDSYATDVSGPTGNSGLAGKYMINAFDIPGTTYQPGLVITAEARGAYTAGPVGLVGSAAGYDLMPLMTLLQLASLEITAIAQNGVNLRNNDYLSNNAKLSIKLADPGLAKRLTRVLIELRKAVSHELVDSIDVSRYLDEYQFTYTVPEGTYDLTAVIYDDRGNSGLKEVTGLVVTPEQLALQLVVDKTIWKPKSGQNLNMAYSLSKDMDVTIYGLNVAGEISKMKFAAAGTMGGKAGYNQITMDGKAIKGGYLGDGIYVFQVTSGGKILGKMKLVVKD